LHGVEHVSGRVRKADHRFHEEAHKTSTSAVHASSHPATVGEAFRWALVKAIATQTNTRKRRKRVKMRFGNVVLEVSGMTRLF
jgi:hypothetical protein